jgi:ATP-dependent Clp protease adapter protein ClpS
MTTIEEPRREVQTRHRPSQKTKLLPPHAVILHNDPINGFDFVIGVLRQVFGYDGGKAFWLTLRAHLTGRSVVWSGCLEVAELRAEQIAGCGPDPAKISFGAQPLRVSIEELPQ